MNSQDFAQLNPARVVAVLPLGATEQHGPHLPLNVDSVLVDGVVDAALTHLDKQDPVLVLPTQTVGLSTEHIAFAGTLTLSPQTVISQWCDLGASVARAGVKKLLLFNAHGGNVGLMDVVARELRAQHGLIVYSSSWYNLPLDEKVMAQFSADEHRFGIHAGDIETSMMLALAPVLTGCVRWLKARLMGRRGPHPLQPWRDFLKLLKKRPVLAENASIISRAAPYVAVASALLAAALVPSFARATFRYRERPCSVLYH
jgi:creatinine amidohydrolase/Fe(II)-dependent formamide hydrolase-like protein